MKKIISILVIFIIIGSITIPSFADDEQEEATQDMIELDEVLQASAEIVKQPQINSRAAVIYDRTSKRVLWGKQENTRRAMASTTKIMTCLVVLEKANLKDIVEISKKAGGTGGSRLGLKAKDKVSVQDLLYGLMLRSGNDAAVALAEYVGGDIKGFAELMNQKANEIGLKDTHFVTPHGLDEIEHYTTAYELACITDYALNNKKFAEIVNTKSCGITINNSPRTLNNTNELLGNLNGVDGVKTGFTNNAGRCLVTSTTRSGYQIICVVLGSDTKKIRTTDSAKLIEYAFANYEYIQAEQLIQQEFSKWLAEYQGNLSIKKAKQTQTRIVLDKVPVKEIPINKQNKQDITVEIKAIDKLEAPIHSGKIIGKVEIKKQEEVILSTNIIIANQIDKKGILDYCYQLMIQYNQYLERAVQVNIF